MLVSLCADHRRARRGRANEESYRLPSVFFRFTGAAVGATKSVMIRPYLPLNALRAFEAAARHSSFKKAAIELNVTPAALSHQVKALEERLGAALFHRLPRGLALTDEGQALLPVLRGSFDRIALLLDRFEPDGGREVVTLGAVGSFALEWLLPRLAAVRGGASRMSTCASSTNNNRVDIAEEGLDFAIRFGDGAWHGTEAEMLFDAPLTPLCAPEVAARLQRARRSGGRDPAALLPGRRLARLVPRRRARAAAAARPGVRFCRVDGGGGAARPWRRAGAGPAVRRRAGAGRDRPALRDRSRAATAIG